MVCTPLGNVRRRVGAAAVPLALVLLAACGSSSSNTTGSSSSSSASSTSSSSTSTGGGGNASADACGLLTTDEVKAALAIDATPKTENVTALSQASGAFQAIAGSDAKASGCSWTAGGVGLAGGAALLSGAATTYEFSNLSDAAVSAAVAQLKSQNTGKLTTLSGIGDEAYALNLSDSSSSGIKGGAFFARKGSTLVAVVVFGPKFTEQVGEQLVKAAIDRT